MIVTAEITGQSALLMNSDKAMYDLRGGTTPRPTPGNLTPREIAVGFEYRDSDGDLYAPGIWIQRSWAMAASYHKQKGTRKTMKTVAAAAFSVIDERIKFLDPEEDKPIKTYEIDSRSIVNQVTRGRQMHHRPRIDRWKLIFDIRLDDRLINADDALNILNEAGYRSGIGSYRISLGGPFGRFAVTGWEIQKDTTEAKITVKDKVRRSQPRANGGART